MKTIITEIKCLVDVLNSILHIAEKRISELKENSDKNILNETRKRKMSISSALSYRFFSVRNIKNTKGEKENG